MIIKLIDKKESSKGALRYARNLAIYMTDADPGRLQPDALGLDYGLTLSTYMTRQTGSNEPPHERVLYRAALLGGEAADWDEGMAQMERRLAVRSSRVKKPARHVVLSYRSGEEPNAEQCHQAVAMLAEGLGCEAAAILWAAHADTDNVHIHALFVTVDPYTGTALTFGQGPDGRANHKEAMQRTIARIEHAQKLQAEAGSRYEVQDGHVVRKPERDAPVAKRTPLRQEMLASEARSGFASFTRVAQDVAGPILDVASSWPNLHRDLAANGIGIRATHNGGELYADDDHVKLSSVDRRHSWTQLIKPERLGPFVEPQDIDILPHEPRILDEMKATAWLKRRDTEQALAAQIDQRVATLIATRETALAEVKANIGAHRDDLARFDGDPRLRRDIAGAWTSFAANATAAISGAFDARISAVRALRNAAVSADELDALDLDGIDAVDAGIVAPWQHDHGAPPLVAIDGYDAERSGDVVRYWAKDDLPRRGQPAIVDAGAIIWLNANSDRTVAAALLLGKERYGEISVFGDRDYLASCARVAERLNLEFNVIPVAQAQRRAKVWKRHHARRLALDAVRRRGDALRRWARAYAKATPLDAGAEREGEFPNLRDVASHSALDRLQSLGSGQDQPVAGRDKPAKSVAPAQPVARDFSGIE